MTFPMEIDIFKLSKVKDQILLYFDLKTIISPLDDEKLSKFWNE